MNKRSIINTVAAGIILVSIFLSSCNAPRKCNGSKGVKTEMGTM